MILFRKCKHNWAEVNRYYGEWKGLLGGGLLTRIVFYCDKCDKYKERQIPGHTDRQEEGK